MMTVRTYHAGLREVWNDFVRNTRNPHFIFQRDYLEYHAERFADSSLLFEKAGRLVVVLPAHRRRDAASGKEILCSHEGLTFGGFLVNPDIRQSEMDAVCAALVDWLRIEGIASFSYRAMPLIYSVIPGEEDFWSLGRLGARVADMKAGAVLRKGESAKTSASFRRQVASAQKAGIEVERSAGWERFHILLRNWLMLRYQSEPVHSCEELKKLADRFPNEIILLVARRDSDWLGGVVVFLTPTCLRLQYVANTVEGMTLGVSQLLVQHMLDSLPLGKWMDLGTSMGTDGDIQPMLHAYKESCGARTFLQTTWWLDV